LQAKEEISRNQQRDATLSEISGKLGVSEKLVSNALEAIVEPISLFDSVYGDGEDTVYVIDKLADEDESDEAWVENISLREAMKRLSTREMGIIERRFYKGRTQMEIAAEIGISQAQVSRLEKGAIDKLRKFMI
jgi:RNA polymerase sporulation-specific sigma factor